MKDTHTPPRSVRVPDDVWEAAKLKAESEGRTVSDVIVSALMRYVRAKGITPPPPSGRC